MELLELQILRSSLSFGEKKGPIDQLHNIVTFIRRSPQHREQFRSMEVSQFDLDNVSLAKAELLWDTGAHSAVVVDELLPQKFKDYLAQPEHDCYRSADGVRVQIDALITFSNQVLALSCVCVVVPRSAVPNSRVGILLGQHMCINKLVYKSVPQAILCARGESVK